MKYMQERTRDWRFLRADGSPVRISAGEVVSGEVLVNNIEFRNWLTDRFPTAIGGENGRNWCVRGEQSLRRQSHVARKSDLRLGRWVQERSSSAIRSSRSGGGGRTLAQPTGHFGSSRNHDGELTCSNEPPRPASRADFLVTVSAPSSRRRMCLMTERKSMMWLRMD